MTSLQKSLIPISKQKKKKKKKEKKIKCTCKKLIEKKMSKT